MVAPCSRDGGVRRGPKYEAIALTTIGQVLTKQGLDEEAVTELENAVAIADGLGSPLAKWETRAALAAAQQAAGIDPGARQAEATAIINGVASSLSAERAHAYLAAPPVRAVLETAHS